ncbi:MAG TPA: glycosyltransferase family 2 protein [Solirubrobacteraceae bacterium]|nr:glycosyltransferase family 2 protein [Solirubrobacteraceae bacterium]
MGLTAAIIVPTRERVGYLDTALASIAPQAARAGAEIVVVDDGPSEATRRIAEAHGARYLAHDAPRGLNAARNTAIDATTADLLVFVDDDVAVREGWLEALLRAAEQLPEDVGVLTGPIHARFEGHRFRSCGREGPPITFLDLGPHDADADHAWGANMAIRRSAIERAGRFDEGRELYGDEQEWQARFKAAGGRIRYIAGAALDHRRAGEDARLRSLARAAYARGGASRRFDEFKGTAPALTSEARTLAACALHTVRRACPNGIVMAAHSAGRLRAALPNAPRPAPQEDFLSGRSGTVGGRRGALRAAADRALDMLDVATVRRARRRRAARATPRATLSVLAIGIERPGPENLMPAALTELRRTRHELGVHVGEPHGRGKFQALNALLAQTPAQGHDWLIVLDDDIVLPRGFLDEFLAAAGSAGLRIAQPAHRLHGHAAWKVTRRRPFSSVRETTFVEIGPLTAFHRDTFEALLPFPDLRMGWGLDAHWAAIARERGWPIGVVDATPVAHTLRAVAAVYPRAEAIAEARAFLAGRPYVRRDEVRTLVVHR